MKEALVFEEEAGRIIVPSQTLATIVSTAVERAGARVRRYPRRSISFDLSAEGGRVLVGIVAPGGAVLPAKFGRRRDCKARKHPCLFFAECCCCCRC